jgi:hypothetical protein
MQDMSLADLNVMKIARALFEQFACVVMAPNATLAAAAEHPESDS